MKPEKVTEFLGSWMCYVRNYTACCSLIVKFVTVQTRR